MVNMKKRNVLSPHDKERMMSVVIRNFAVFEVAIEELKTEHFDATEAVYALIWGVVINFYADYAALPERDLIFAEVQSLLDQDEDILNNTEQEDLEAWLDEAYDETISPPYHSEKYTKWGCTQLRRFLEERLVLEIQQTVSTGNRVVVDLPSMLGQHQQASDRIAQIGISGSAEMFPEDWDKSGGIHIKPTGLTFVDELIGGGHAPGECYGLLGPFGSCKTTTGIMLAVNACKQAAEEKDEPDWDGKRSLAFFVTYEARLDNEIRLRSLSYAAQILRSSLESMGEAGLATLSTTNKLKKYEKIKYKKDLIEGYEVLGEQERAKQAMQLLNRHFRVLDMTGYDENARGAGSGFVSEIARRISWEIRKEKDAKVAIVCVDYVGAMAKRHLASIGKDENYLRHLITGAGLQARNQLADQFNAPVWLLHQLSGEANAKGPHAKLHHTSSAESKSFAENLDFALVVGQLNDANLCQISCTKHRRTAGHVPIVLKLTGEFNRADGMQKKYQVNQANGQIESVALEQSVTSKKKAEKVLEGYNNNDALDPSFYE